MFGPSIKLDKELYDRVKRCADAGGYSSPKEFIQHVLEKELQKFAGDESDEEIVKKLQGLGYIE
jgi:metal-responsive CopG/Arc/MetJ family transcriptional regulator